MITQRTQVEPQNRSGYLCQGKVDTDAGGVGLITVKGRDYSGRITGISLIPLDESDLIINCSVTSIVYDAATRLTTITFKAQTQTGSLQPVSQLQTGIVTALEEIVTGAPTDVAALLSEITTAAAVIENTLLEVDPPTGVAFDGDIFYSFWVDDEEEGLPSAAFLAANDTEEQAY